MFKLAHLSDMHLAPPGRPRGRQLLNKRLLGYLNWYRSRRAIHQRPVLDMLIADILSQRPDHIAVTGDLVNFGLPSEFKQALAWLHSLGAPKDVSVVPGNHDAYVSLAYETGMGVWKDYMSGDTATGIAFHPDRHGFPYVRLRGEVALIGLCSAVPTLPFMAAGRLGAAQLRALPPILDALRQRDLCRVLMIHHPPMPRLTSWRRALRDATALDAILAAHGVELVVYGHNHQQTLTSLNTVAGPAPVVCVPSASVGTLGGKVLAGYGLYTIERADGGGWRILMQRRGMTVPGGGIEEVEQKEIGGAELVG